MVPRWSNGGERMTSAFDCMFGRGKCCSSTPQGCIPTVLAQYRIQKQRASAPLTHCLDSCEIRRGMNGCQRLTRSWSRLLDRGRRLGSEAT